MVDDVAVDNHASGVAWRRGAGWAGEDICVILRPCVEALARFHALGGDACLCEKSVCKRRYRQMSITEASLKLNSTQEARASNQSGLMRKMGRYFLMAV
jgi:hypothetical protein